MPVFLLLLFIEVTVRGIPNDYSYKRKYLEAHAGEIELLVLGSSHGFYGINPDYLSINAFNASNVSQSPKFDFFIFKQFYSKFDRLQFVILPVSYPTLFFSTDSGTEKWREKNYVLYYDYPNGSFRSQLELFNGTFKEKTIWIIDWLKENANNKSCSKYGYGLKFSNAEQSDLYLTAIEASNRHTAQNYSLLNENKKYIEQLIQNCLYKNIKVVLYTSPACSTYTKLLDEKQLKITHSFCHKITKKYPNVYYFDFLNDNRFVKEDFRDADHTNHKGAKKLTLILDNVLESIVVQNAE